MIVGRNPGRDEDEEGRPFVGPAGGLLDDLIEWAGFERRQFVIDNLAACYSEGNEPPTRDQVRACWHWLQQEIQLIQPDKIVALGVMAVEWLTGVKLKITKAVGHVYPYGDLFSYTCPVLCLPHPSYYLRAGLTEISRKEIIQAVDVLQAFFEGRQ